MNELAGLILGLVLFLCTILSFILGCRVGKQLSQGIVPKMNPIQPIVKAIETHKADKEQAKLSDELEDIMGATRETMLQAIKEAR